MSEEKAPNVLGETETRLLDFLVAEFRDAEGFRAPEAIADTEAARKIVERYRNDPQSVTRSDIFALDLLILRLQPTERLLFRAPQLRIKYAELAGTKLAAAYQPSPLPPDEKIDDPRARRLLLADLQQILGFIHWNYFFTPLREGIRRSIIRKAAGIMAVYTVSWAAACALFIHLGFPFYALTITVVYAGLMGGYVSSQRRMQLIPTQGDPLGSIFELENGQYFLWFAPLTGAVFAVVLMLLFISGVLAGTIFPAFPKMELEGALELQKLLPTSNANYALLFLWSFIAGFAEQFVPDSLDRLISRAQNSMGSPPSGGGETNATLSSTEMGRARTAMGTATRGAPENMTVRTFPELDLGEEQVTSNECFDVRESEEDSPAAPITPDTGEQAARRADSDEQNLDIEQQRG